MVEQIKDKSVTTRGLKHSTLSTQQKSPFNTIIKLIYTVVQNFCFLHKTQLYTFKT